MIGTAVPLSNAAASPTPLRAAAQKDVRASDTDGDGTLDSSNTASAVADAAADGRRVEDTSQRTETTQVFANPDRTFTAEIYPAPVRMERKDGSWDDIDLDLVKRADGSWGPKASPTDVSIGGGSSEEAVRVNFDDGQSLAVTLPETLPAPNIEGGVATYKLSDTTNLVVTTTTVGANAHIVLSAPPADDDPSFELGLRADGVKVSESAGGLKVADEDGHKVATTSHLVAWDSDVNKSGEPTTVVPLSADLTNVSRKGDVTTSTLSLTTPDAFLNDPATTYPVTIDPNIAIVHRNADTWMRSGDGDRGAEYRLISGKINGGSNTNPARAFLAWDISAFMGKNVLYSQLDLWQFQAYDCANRVTNVRAVTSPWGAGTTWPDMPSINTTSAYLSSTFGNTAGAAGCGPTWATSVTTNLARAWASGSIPNYGVALVAGDETKSSYERRFCSANPVSGSSCGSADYSPRLSVSYNTAPAAPAPPSASMSGPTATLSTQVTDPDGGSVRARFIVRKNGSPIYDGYSGYVGSGGQASLAISGLGDGYFTVNAYTNDGQAESGASFGSDFSINTGVYDLNAVRAAMQRSWARTATSSDGNLLINYGLGELMPGQAAPEVQVEYSDDDATPIVAGSTPEQSSTTEDAGLCSNPDGSSCLEVTPQPSDVGLAVDPEAGSYTAAYTSAAQTLTSCDAGSRARRFTYRVRGGSYLPASTVYRWKHVVQYCTKDGKVVKWRRVYDTIYDLAPWVTTGQLMPESYRSALPASTAKSFLRREVTQCPPLAGVLGGCISAYPQAQLNVTGDGGKKATRIKTG